MKDFEHENMNAETNDNMRDEVKNDSMVNDIKENNNNIEAQPVDNIQQAAQNEQNTAQTASQNDPIRENPYFRGYSEPQKPNYNYGNQYQNFQYDQQNQPNQQNQQNQQNPYSQPMNRNPYWRETPYNNPYSQQNNQPQYNRPEHSSGQISYTPSTKNSKKSKDKKSTSKAAIAVACAATIVLSGCFGFGGAMLANSMNSENAAQNTVNAVNTSSNVQNSPVVIYKNVEDVATSTGNVGDNLTYSQVAAMVKDSVVEIVTEFNNQSIWYQYVTQGAGSGVIISTDGYIITNAHVITDESNSTVADNITVRLTDSTEHNASVIAYDSDADIAIIKIEAEGLVPAQCGDSDKLTVGEELVVVGNPLGELGGSVTNGIVSATEREIQMGGVTMHLIQTNAAVNPGNSGGGMFNMKGQLVGIINAKSTGTGIEGLGFAIPINTALEVSEQLLQYGYVRGKTMIGVSFQDVSSNNYYYYYNIKAGVYVAELTEGYNDDVLKVGDRVIAVNGEEVTSSQDIKAVVTSSSVGDKIKFQLYRDNKLMEVEVTCYEKVPDSQANIQFEQESNSKIEQETEAEAYYNPFSGGLEEFFFGGNH